MIHIFGIKNLLLIILSIVILIWIIHPDGFPLIDFNQSKTPEYSCDEIADCYTDIIQGQDCILELSIDDIISAESECLENE